MPTHQAFAINNVLHNSSESVITYSLTLPAAGTNRIVLLANMAFGGGPTAVTSTAQTVNGVAPTGQFTDLFTGWSEELILQVFYWLEADLPANGSPTAYNVSLTSGTTVYESNFAAVVATDAAQTAPINSSLDDLTGVNTATVPITTTSANMLVYDFLGVRLNSDASITASPTAGQTKIAEALTGSHTQKIAAAHETIASAGSYNQTWSWTPGSTYASLSYAIALAHSAGGGGGEPDVVNTFFAHGH